MIETKNLTKTFDNFTAVDSLDLKIETGEFFGLLGPNGAGKTTTISLLSTLLLPTKGEILIDGQKLTRNRPDLKRKISVITQEYSMRQDMNMDEIMEYQGRLYFMPRKEIKRRTEELLEFCDLIKFRKRTISHLRLLFRGQVTLPVHLQSLSECRARKRRSKQNFRKAVLCMPLKMCCRTGIPWESSGICARMNLIFSRFLI